MNFTLFVLSIILTEELFENNLSKIFKTEPENYKCKKCKITFRMLECCLKNQLKCEFM